MFRPLKAGLGGRQTALHGRHVHILRIAALGCALWAAGQAHASSCNGNGTTKKIAFAKGAACWTYTGTASYFTGRFSRGQVVTVRMSGVAEFMGENGQVVSSVEPREPFATGPREFYAGDLVEAGVLRFKGPATGRYEISFSPCAMQGGMGDVTVCAK